MSLTDLVWEWFCEAGFHDWELVTLFTMRCKRCDLHVNVMHIN